MFLYSDAHSHRHSHCGSRMSGLDMHPSSVGLCAGHEMDVFNADILDRFFTSGLGNNHPLFNASDETLTEHSTNSFSNLGHQIKMFNTRSEVLDKQDLTSPSTFRDLLEI
jgi:hypothetical protein